MVNKYKLTGEIELLGQSIPNPEFEREFVGFNEKTLEAQVDVRFFYTANGKAQEVVRSWPRTFNPEFLEYKLGDASELAMLNLPEIKDRYTLIEE